MNLKKERFVGREALAAEKPRASRNGSSSASRSSWDSLERLYAEVGLAPRLPAAAWRTSVPIYAGGEQAGYATSGGWSPLLKKYIALAHLRAALCRARHRSSRWRSPSSTGASAPRRAW